MRVFACVLCLVLLAAGATCHNTEQNRSEDDQAVGSGGSPGDNRQAVAATGSYTGTVRYIDIEGGFYGIETDKGLKLDPVNLPSDFQKDGVRVRVQIEPLKDRISFHMWGTLVRIVAIERL